MTTYDEVLSRLLDYLEPHADEGVELDRETDLVTTLRLDSHKVLDILLDVEDDFDVAVPMNALADIRTVGELAGLIHRLVEEEG